MTVDLSSLKNAMKRRWPRELPSGRPGPPLSLTVGVIILLFTVALTAWLIYHPRYVKVPDVNWLSGKKAAARLDHSGLKMRVKGTFASESVQAGHIIEQHPEAGKSARLGSTIEVTVSTGYPSVSVPDLVGLDMAEVGAKLRDGRMALGTIHMELSGGARPAATAEIVMRQSPSAGMTARANSAVDIWAGSRDRVVPALIGREWTAARDILGKDNFLVQYASDTATQVRPGVITSQIPAAGTAILPGGTVYLVISGPLPAAARASTAVTPAAPAAPKPAASSYIVCIDPGHQARGSNAAEPIGPGSRTTKPEVSSGATGVATHVPEYKINLAISLRLKSVLERMGVKVVMTRTTNEVTLSNIDRANIANKAGSDLFIRVHCNGSPDAGYHGITTLYPTKNQWTGPIFQASLQAAQSIQKAIIKSVGSGDLGITPRGDMTGFNWSRVPVVIVECGFLSNPEEDRKLNNPAYQSRLASGMANGILQFLRR